MRKLNAVSGEAVGPYSALAWVLKTIDLTRPQDSMVIAVTAVLYLASFKDVLGD